MSDMIKKIVIATMDDQIATQYPHLQNPSCMYARVTKATQIVLGNYKVSLKILDKIKNIDTNFPEVPLVSTTISFEIGDIAIVTLLYGECNPFIIGRYLE